MDNKNILTNDFKLLKLLKDKFDNFELLKLNFSLYIANKNNKNKFIINLYEVFKWIGFSRKDHAKKLLTKENNGFKINIDYIINYNQKNNKGGQKEETILLTTKCFKIMCLIARTSESRKFYDYYITLEEVISEYFENKYIEENLILTKELNELKNKYRERMKQGYVYIFTTDKKDIYKCGRSINIEKRKNTLQTGLINDIKIINYFYCSNSILLENIVHNLLHNYRCNNREHFNCDNNILINIIYIFGTLINIIKNEYINELEILKKYVINIKNSIKIIDVNEKYIYILKNDISNNLIIKVCNTVIKTEINDYKNIIYNYKSKNAIIIYKLIKYKILNIDNIDNIINIMLYIDNIINLIKSN